MAAFRYKAFLSYSWRDRGAAEALHRALEIWRPPTDRGAEPPLRPIFRDRDEEAAGASLRAAIEDALDNAEFLIVVCSPNSAASPWVNKEIAYFRKKRTPANILCYAIAGDPGSSAIPPALFFETDIDGTLKDTPIDAPLAADARTEGDGVRLARLKIIAAMMNVGLDDLVRRESVRRVRRLRRLLAGASALAVAFAGVALYAFVQRDVAVKNEARAKREAMKAERTAEFMVGLFEVPDPSESRGREVTAREILDKGVKTIETDLAAEPDVQASLMHTMGRSYTGLGLYPDAARILTVARDKRVEAKADPGDLYATKVALARAVFEKGDLDAAHDLYKALVKEAGADIAKGGWRSDYASALIGMGETTLYRDTPEEAQTYYELARDLLDGHELGESEAMAAALQGLANAEMDQEKFDSSKQNFLEAIQILENSPQAFEIRLSNIQSDLGALFYRQKKFELAIERFRTVEKIESNLLGPLHPESLMTRNNIGRILIELGDIDEGVEEMSLVVAQSRKIGRDNFFEFIYPLNTFGLALTEAGKFDEAEKVLVEAVNLNDAKDSPIYPEANLNLGRVECQNGNATLGFTYIQVGRDALEKFYQNDDWRYGIANEYQSRCEYRIGNIGEAQSLAEAALTSLRHELTSEHYFTRRAQSWRDAISGRKTNKN